MTDADTTRTTTYLVQFTGIVSGKWVDAAVEPFATWDEADTWIYEHIPDHTSRIVKRTTTDEIVCETVEQADADVRADQLDRAAEGDHETEDWVRRDSEELEYADESDNI